MLCIWILRPTNLRSQHLVLPELPFHNCNTPVHTRRVHFQERCKHLHLSVCVGPSDIRQNLTCSDPLPILSRTNYFLRLLSQCFTNLFHKRLRFDRQFRPLFFAQLGLYLFDKFPVAENSSFRRFIILRPMTPLLCPPTQTLMSKKTAT
jgi:hypothetical protein